MNRRLASALLALALTASACVFFSTSETVAPPPTTSATAELSNERQEQSSTTSTTTPESTSRPTPGVAVDIAGCSDPTDEFAILCDAYETLTERYVDDLADADLAAGALRGLSEYGGVPGPADDQDLTCHVPSSDFAEFCETLVALETDEGLTDDSLVESGIRGMLDFGVGDPNTNYFDPELFQDFSDSNAGQVQGIGSLVNTVNLEVEEEPCIVISLTCDMVIVSPLPGSPSEAAGLQPDDVILEVDGEPITGMTLDEVVSIVRGPAGTDVRLVLERDGSPFEVTITREAISIPIVEAEMLTDDVGYIRLVQFTFGSASPFRDELGGLVDQGARTIIFDLQSNPGGSLDDSVAIASEFLTDGIVVRTESPDRSIDYDVREGGVATDPDLDVFVLINGGSASASEVVAGALADQGRATLVGEATFGKNTVQQNFPLDNGGALKVTIARWVTPNGTDFGQVGIQPDIFVEYPESPTFEFLRDEVLRRLEAGEL